MSWPIITYGQAVHNDCDSTTGYTKTDDGNTSTFTVVYGDYFKLNVTVSGGNEETKVVNDTNYSASTTTYTKILWRYKCSNASIKAKLIAEFSDASTQEVMADSNSTSWTVPDSVTLTTGKTLDHIRMYADHATGIVYYDFAIVYMNEFTFPGAELVELTGAFPRRAPIDIPRKDGVDPQNLGSNPAQVRILADMSSDTTTWNYGKVFDMMSHDMSAELWQYLWLPAHDRHFKVTLADAPRYPFVDRKLSVRLLFEEYKLADARQLENYAERFGH